MVAVHVVGQPAQYAAAHRDQAALQPAVAVGAAVVVGATAVGRERVLRRPRVAVRHVDRGERLGALTLPDADHVGAVGNGDPGRVSGPLDRPRIVGPSDTAHDPVHGVHAPPAGNFPDLQDPARVVVVADPAPSGEVTPVRAQRVSDDLHIVPVRVQQPRPGLDQPLRGQPMDVSHAGLVLQALQASPQRRKVALRNERGPIGPVEQSPERVGATRRLQRAWRQKRLQRRSRWSDAFLPFEHARQRGLVEERLLEHRVGPRDGPSLAEREEDEIGLLGHGVGHPGPGRLQPAYGLIPPQRREVPVQHDVPSAQLHDHKTLQAVTTSIRPEHDNVID